MYSLDDLLLFFKVVELGSFTNVATHLKIAQSTVSRRIKNLEDNLNLVLIKRNSSKFEISEAGSLLYENAGHSLNSVNDIIQETKEMNSAIKGTLNIALPPLLSYELISPKLANFLIQYPEINLHISFTNTDINMLDSGFDVAVVNHLPTQNSQKIRFLLTAEALLYCTKAYANRYGVPQKPDELSKHLITGALDYKFKAIQSVLEVSHRITGEQFSVSMPNRIRTNDSLQSTKLLHTDHVITSIYDFSEDAHNTNLIAVLPDYRLFNMSYYLMRHNTDTSMKTKVFCDFILKCVKI